MATVTLTITGMTCDHCVESVARALKGVKGVYGALVELDRGAAEVDFDEARATPERLIAAVETAGYGARLAA